jgi:carboxyl-terminal processing protease
MKICILKIIIAVLLFISHPFNAFCGEEEPSKKYNPNIPSYKDIQLLSKALTTLQYASLGTDNQDKRIFVYAALTAMAEALDRHSFFVPPDIMDFFIESRKAKFAGIGIRISKSEKGFLEITSVEQDGPAYKAGLRSGDVIIEIEGNAVNTMRLLDSLRLIRNPALPAGSTVSLSVIKKGDTIPSDFVITREFIKSILVESKMLEKGYGYLKIKEFKKGVATDIQESLKNLNSESNLHSLVIDLRNNPGGEIESAVECLRLFVHSGILTTIETTVPERQTIYKAYDTNLYAYPLVILVNEGSASASELFVGAMQFHKRGTVLGRKTFGKGTFQSFVPIAEDMGLYITLGKYFLPDGSSVEGKGVIPEIMIEKDEDEDVIINKALQMLKTVPTGGKL